MKPRRKKELQSRLETRRHHRFGTDNNCEVTSTFLNDRWRGVVSDLSASGAKIRFDKFEGQRVGQVVNISISLKDVGKNHLMLANVIWVHQEEFPNLGCTIGVEFLK